MPLTGCKGEKLMIVLNEIKLELLSKSANESFARVVAAAFVSQLDPTLEELADIKTAVSEAVTNSIIHGYENKTGIIVMKCKLYKTSVEIEISDNGKGIEDIEIARQPLYTSKPEMERSGMGFTVMESFMDKVEIESVLGQGTTIKMYKELNSLI
jgi:stage II sporulation protein AB (anti-sigma F factor)